MNTQIVYAVVSSPDDFYLEQMWASIYSLRLYHPEARVVVLTDEPTGKRIREDGTYRLLLDMITDLRLLPMPADYDGKKRSREIKTTMRNHVEGDYFYIDTDTIITGPLDDIDRFDYKNIAMVPDRHRISLGETGLLSVFAKTKIKKIFNINVSDSSTYYNAGVQFVRDNPLMREFFHKWHESWLEGVSKGCLMDQISLMYVNVNYGYIIEKLPDVYNCQDVEGAKYWCQAKIIHIFNELKHFNIPFRLLKDIPRRIHEKQGMEEEVKDMLANAKNHLSVHTCFCSYYDFVFMSSEFYQLYQRNRYLRWCINKFNYWAKKRSCNK